MSVIRAWILPLTVMAITALAIGGFLHPSRGGAAGFAAVILYSLICSAYIVYRMAPEDEPKPSRRPVRRAPRGTH